MMFYDQKANLARRYTKIDPGKYAGVGQRAILARHIASLLEEIKDRIRGT